MNWTSDCPSCGLEHSVDLDPYSNRCEIPFECESCGKMWTLWVGRDEMSEAHAEMEDF